MATVRHYFELVKFQHTIFALPFALTAAVVCARGVPRADKIAWILVAMVGARTAAMGFNRIVDRDYDRMNPRTQGREIPAGEIRVPQAIMLVLASSVAFILAAMKLNTLAFVLSFPTLAILLGYSFTKRFTSYSHFVLGLSLGIAPIGAWVALQGRIAIEPILLGAGVMFWVAGFDIIYATLDREFDERVGLHSFVQKFGVERSLWWSRVFHLLFVVLLASFGIVAHLGTAFCIGVVLIGCFLIYEHRLVRPDDLSRVNVAFFTVNGVVSIAVFTFTCLDIAVRRIS